MYARSLFYYPPKLSKRMSASSTPSEWSRSRTVLAIIVLPLYSAYDGQDGIGPSSAEATPPVSSGGRSGCGDADIRFDNL